MPLKICTGSISSIYALLPWIGLFCSAVSYIFDHVPPLGLLLRLVAGETSYGCIHLQVSLLSVQVNGPTDKAVESVAMAKLSRPKQYRRHEEVHELSQQHDDTERFEAYGTG